VWRAHACHLAGAGREVVEQVELPRAQVELRPVQRRFPRPRVDPQAADDHRLVPVLTGAGSAQDGSYPRVQLRATERLYHVVVGAGLENGDDLRIAVAGGGDDDGDVVDRPQHCEHVTAVEVGQSQVEHHQIRMLGHDQVQRLCTGGRGGHGMPTLTQSPDQAGPDVRIVLDQQHVRHSKTLSEADGCPRLSRRALRLP
jgi:hypothetical protein